MKKIISRLLKVVSVILFFLVSYNMYSIWSFADENQLVRTDAAVVLGAAAWDKKPSPVFQERINHAIWLYEQQYVEKIIFTGGRGEGAEYAESEVAKAYAIAEGVKEKDILIETKSKITEENLAQAKLVAASNQVKTMTIVSDPLHMKRAIAIARQLDMKVYSSPTQTSEYKTLKTKLPFLWRELFIYTGYKMKVFFE